MFMMCLSLTEVFNGDFVTSSMASQDGLNSTRSTQSAACHPPVTSRPVHNTDTTRVDEDTSHGETPLHSVTLQAIHCM